MSELSLNYCTIDIPLPAVPLEDGLFQPQNLMYVLSTEFIEPYTDYAWAATAVNTLLLAEKDPSRIFIGWRRPPDFNTDVPSDTNPPTWHDLIEALHSLYHQMDSCQTFHLSLRLQNLIADRNMSAEESEYLHAMMRRYPLLTLHIAEQMPPREESTAQVLLGEDKLSVPPRTEPLRALRAEDKAEEQMKRLERLDTETKDKPKVASRTHLILTTCANLAFSVGLFILNRYHPTE